MDYKLKSRLLVSLMLSVPILLCKEPSVLAKTAVGINNMEYILNEEDKTASLTNGKDAKSTTDTPNYLEVPDSIDDNGISYRVISIDDKAFSGSGVTFVTIPESVERIGKNAFAECKNLTTLALSSENTTIEEFAFYGSGITDLKIPGGVSYIGDSAFSNCVKLKTVFLPTSVTYLGNNVFSWCKELEEVTLPEGIKEIPDMAFYHCPKLKYIKIPDSVEVLGTSSFEWCTSLESVEFSESLISIKDQAFSRCTELDSVVIPEGVRSIGSRAFDGCSSLEYIEIPGSVNSVGNLAFGNSDEDVQTKLRRVTCVRNSYVDNRDLFFNWSQYGIEYPEFSYKISSTSASGSIFGEYTYMSYVAVGILLIVIIAGIVIIFKNRDNGQSEK